MAGCGGRLLVGITLPSLSVLIQTYLINRLFDFLSFYLKTEVSGLTGQVGRSCAIIT